MESLSEQEAMRVLKAAAALDALRTTGSRSAALVPGRLPVAPQLPPPLEQQQQSASQQQQQQPQPADGPPSPTQALGEDVWREMAETEGGEQKRHGDLDSWLDVFRATAGSVRTAWRSREAITFESLAFGWLALARKHESLQSGPPAAAGDQVTTDTPKLAGWLEEAQWAQAAYRVSAPAQASASTVDGGAEVAAAEGGAAAAEQRLVQLLALRPGDLMACRLEPNGWRPGFFLAVHHDSRTVRLVIRGTCSLPDLLNPAAAETSPLGSGSAHRGLLAAAQQLLEEAGPRLRGAVEANPGYGLRCIGHSDGAGIAALLAVLLSPEGPCGGPERVGCPAGGVRATCFGPPPTLSCDLAERHADAIDTVVYNADLWSRCCPASLRRLTSEMSAASTEVLARSELAQALRRSGALGLANHLVAAALCRCQPPQDSHVGSLGAAPPGLAAAPSRTFLLTDGLTALGANLARPAALAAAAPPPPPALPAQPSGRPGHLTTLGSQLKLAAGGGSGGPPLDPFGAGKPAGGGGAAAAPPQPMPPPPPPPLPPPAAPPTPLGPPTGTLPPLTTAVSLACVLGGVLGGGGAAAAAALGVGGVAVSAARPGGIDSPHRRPPEAQSAVGVLSPPPLVAAAAAAAAAATVAGPPPSRRSRLGRSYSDDGSRIRAAAAAAAAMGAAPLLEPLAVPPPLLLPAGSAVPSVLPMPGARREPVVAGDGTAATSAAAVAAAAAVPAAAATSPAAALPPLLPPMLLPALPSSVGQPQSPRLSRQVQVTYFEPFESPPPPLSQGQQSELTPERSLRSIALPQLPDGSSFHKHPQLPLPALVLQLLPSPPPLQPQQDSERVWAEEGPELFVPGVVHIIERRGADAHASFRLLRDVSRSHLPRILLKRSMLRDHLLCHYVAALERIMQMQRA